MGSLKLIPKQIISNGGISTGTCNFNKNEISISLGACWEYVQNIPCLFREEDKFDTFVNYFSSVLGHEFCHKVIYEDLKSNPNNYNLGFLQNTRMEWIVKKWNNEPMNELSLLHYTIQDVSYVFIKKTNIIHQEYSKRIKYYFFLIMCLYILIFSVLIWGATCK
jgi:hypothetical protein